MHPRIANAAGTPPRSARPAALLDFIRERGPSHPRDVQLRSITASDQLLGAGNPTP
jgi:hypothetical protein